MRYWNESMMKIEDGTKIRVVASSYFNDDKKRFNRCKSFIYSILSQTYENFELFIVHDGAITECQEKQDLLNIIKSDSRITLFETPERLEKWGYPHRKKYAFIDEEFDWLVYTNDDNYYIPTALEMLLGTAQKNKKMLAFSNMISSHRTWDSLDTFLKLGYIDLGCLMFKKSLIRNFSFDLEGDCFEADGKLVDEIVEAIGVDNCIKVNNFLFIHN